MSSVPPAGGPREDATGSKRHAPPQLVRPGETPPSAVLDSAHVGDIEGALGRIRLGDVGERRTRRQRLITLLAIVGPGLIVMVGDNDAGGVSTYAQAGQNYGTSLLWVLLLLVPVLIVNQEMVVRLGTVTGVGHARLINERFGRFWGAFSVGDLFVLNFLTIVTEFIGVALAAEYLGISQYAAVPLAALTLVAVATSGSFRRFERFMLAFIAVSLVLYPMALLSHPRWGRIAHDFVVPGIQGGVSSGAVLLIIAIVGTTVAPWQLFFQQSNVIDKRITPRFINYERTDTVLGSAVVVLGAAALMVAADYAFRASPQHGHFSDALGVARGLGHMGHGLGTLFAIALLDASIIGAVAVTLATSYAFGDVFNMRHSLHRGWRDARKFYGSYTAMVVVAAVIVLIPGAPLGLITTSVQALAGLLLPSASVFLLLLCNDPVVLGPWVNKSWLNALASLIIAVLLVLSGVLMATTLFPKLDVTLLFLELSAAMAVFGGAGLVYVRIANRGRAARPPLPPMGFEEKMAWRMPQLALLEPVKWSPGLRLGMSALRGYLVISAVLLLVKAIRLGH
ncbi:MAG TPA: NRAMP family divalent metal transporter [Acidimicrobiales bacterium]|nr:NRAMP family divalent metal transporter [Acidimicrobiales bacterium]